MIRVWDLWIRLFHWSLAFSVGFLLLSGETGTGFFDWHRLVGEFVLALIVFRILWGVVGSSNARLIRLVAPPSSVIHHLLLLLKRHTTPERGHNAAGGWAVIAMLLLISLQALTGIFIADEDELVEGRWYGVLPDNISNFFYEVHQFNADLIQIIVVVHLVAITSYFVLQKRNLVTPMLTGKMKWDSAASVPKEKFAGTFTGAVLFAVVLLAAAFLFNWVDAFG